MNTPLIASMSVPAPSDEGKITPLITAKKKTKRVNAMRHLVRRGRIWYFKRMVQGRPVWQSLGTDDLALAKAKRDDREALAAAGELQKLKSKGVRRITATVGDVCAAYEEGIRAAAAGRIEDRTVASATNSLKTFLRWVKGSGKGRDMAIDVDALSLDELTAEAANTFKKHYLASAGDDRLAVESRRRGAASVLRQAKSVFSERAMTLYSNLVLPPKEQLDAWKAAGQVEAEARQHVTIEPATRRAMHEAITGLKESNPQLWLIHTLTKVAGLRNNELCEARVEWFQRAPWGQVFLSVVTRPYFEPKGSEGHVPLTKEVARELYDFVKGKQPLDYLIVAKTMTDRDDLVNREHAAWIRQFLPADKFAKAGYELRRLGAQAMELRYGREAAEAFLRHAPKSVAERHYLERFFPWRRFGEDVGVCWEDVTGGKAEEGSEVEKWKGGAEALKF